jgi:hypothetical protein
MNIWIFLCKKTAVAGTFEQRNHYSRHNSKVWKTKNVSNLIKVIYYNFTVSFFLQVSFLQDFHCYKYLGFSEIVHIYKIDLLKPILKLQARVTNKVVIQWPNKSINFTSSLNRRIRTLPVKRLKRVNTHIIHIQNEPSKMLIDLQNRTV